MKLSILLLVYIISLDVFSIESNEFEYENNKVKLLLVEKKNNKLNLGIFEGLTINTPSMLVVEDWLTIIDWANSSGGLEYLKLKTKENFQVINKFCKQNDWIDFLAPNKLFRSNTSVCLKFIDNLKIFFGF